MSRRRWIPAFAAVLAFSAFFAGSALAQFESENSSTTVTRSANGPKVFTYSAAGVKVTCTTVGGSGTISGKASTDFTFSPIYSGCTHTLSGSATFNFNGCSFTYTSAAKSTAMTDDFVCPAEKEITITINDSSGSLICTLHIPGGQTPKGTITGSNSGAGATREIKVVTAMTGIIGRRTGSALCGPATSTTGTSTGEIVFTGEVAGVHTGIFMD